MTLLVPRSRLSQTVFSWETYPPTLSFHVVRSLDEEMFLLQATCAHSLKRRLFLLFWPRRGVRRDDVVTMDAHRIQLLHHTVQEKKVRMVLLEDISWHQWEMMPKHVHPETFQTSMTSQSVAYFWRQLNPIYCLHSDPQSMITPHLCPSCLIK